MLGSDSTAKRPQRSRRRLLLWFGAVLFLGGAAILSIGLFSQVDDGSSGSAETTSGTAPVIRTHTAPTPTVTDEAPPSPTATPPRVQDTAYRMIIDRIDVDAPVYTYGLDENSVPVVPTGTDAADVVAWYDFSAQPGTGNNAVFAAHVTWFGKAVFWELEKLEIGDTVRLEAEDGTELVYTVEDNFLVDPSLAESLEVMSSTPTDTVTLITCGGSFVDTGDPVFGGEYSDRRVVRAQLESMEVVGTTEVHAGGS